MAANNHISVDFASQLQSNTNHLMAFAFSLTKNDNDAEDLLQDTVFLALKNQEKFSAGTNFVAWIKTIMRNTFINNYRKQKRFKNILAKGVGGYFFSKKTSENTTDVDMNVQEIEILIDKIDERFSVPFRLYHQGYSYEEITKKLKLPMGTVKSRIFFARKHLKTAYQQHFSEMLDKED